MIYNLPTFFLPGAFYLTPGTAADYHALARFHYAPTPPATFAAVVCVRWYPFQAGCADHAAAAALTDIGLLPRRSAGRRLKRANRRIAPRASASPFVRLTLSGPGSSTVRSAAGTAAGHPRNETSAPTDDRATADFFDRTVPVPDPPSRLVGVVVLSYPSALNRTRHRVFGLRPLRLGHRLRWVNANLRTISRVIIHPQFRGLGLSGALIGAAIDVCPTPLIETCARMGRVHPLFDRVGFERVVPETDEEPIYYWRRRNACAPRFYGGPVSAGPYGSGRTDTTSHLHGPADTMDSPAIAPGK